MDTFIVTVSLVIYAIPAVLMLGYGGWLSAYDIRTHRLPNRHVAILSTVVLSSELLISGTTGDWHRSISATQTSLATLAFYAVLYLISKRQIGMGDVKYAVPTGLVLGFYNPDAWLTCIFLTFALAGSVSLFGMATKRLTRSTRIAFGPYMTISTLVLVVSNAVNSP